MQAFTTRPYPPPPLPTYRHLLAATSLTPYNPLRVIAHCDIDAAYAQFEAVRLGLPDDVPLIVIQWDTIIAVNYPARKYGIKRTSSQGAKEARELCPHIVIAHTATYRPGEEESGYWEDANVLTHKVSLDPYRRESAKIIAIFKEMMPKGEVEKASIDEAYMDFTPQVIDKLLSLHPHLAAVPDDATEGLDTPLPPAPPIDWTLAGNVIPTSSDSGVDGETQGEIEKPTWEDWALCLGAEMMAEVRAEIWKRLHYTCSAGIAHNKAMAKLCSSWRKPNAQTVLRHAAVPSFLHDRAFTDIRNLGGKLGHSIAAVFEAATVGELMKVSLEEMQRRFGEEVIWVYNLIRGIDHTDLVPRHVNKSMLASKNLIPAVRSLKDGEHWVDLLAGELAVRLRESIEIAPGLWPKTIVLTHRSGRGYENAGRSRQAPFPYTKALTGEYIAKMGRRMWAEVVAGLTATGRAIEVCNLGLQFTGVERMEEGQKNIEGFFGAKIDRPPSALVKNGESSKRNPSTGPSTPDLGDPHDAGWICPKCRKVLPISNDLSEQETERELAGLKQEHEDYHFALDLQRGGDVRVKEEVPPKKRKKEKDKGIAGFFVKKPKK